MTRRRWVAAAALVSLAGLAACGSSGPSSPAAAGATTSTTGLPLYVPPSTTTSIEPASSSASIVPITTDPHPVLPATVRSADGATVTVTDVTRILPLWGNLSEVVFSLGLGPNVVGRDVAATFAEVRELPVVTRGHDVSAESALSLRPTVVLAQDDTGPLEALRQIRAAGVPVIVVKAPSSLADLAPRIDEIAAALGVPREGADLVARTQAEIDRVTASVPAGAAGRRVAFLYMRGTAGVYLMGGPGSGADSMIVAAGGVDAGTAMGLDRPFTPLTSEALVAARPDVILMTTTGLESVGGIGGLLKIPGIAQTPAGMDRRVVTVEDGLLYSFGARTPEALRQLVAQLDASGGR
jgi:iron complex transport system substrate-binding protein